MCASLQSGVRLRFAPRLQEAFALKCASGFYQYCIQENFIVTLPYITNSNTK